MKSRLRVLFVCAACCLGASLFAQPAPAHNQNADEHLQEEFFSDFHIASAAAEADQILIKHPGDVLALFVRMETAALEQRTDDVLDSAVRLCTMPAPADVQEIASSRILENAGNSRVFAGVLRRVGLAMEEPNACTFNLRLAMVAAAADGSSHLDLDKTAESAGLLTRWRIAGPFGHFSNLDFEHRWPAESSHFWIAPSSAEQFWFRDGMVALPDYFSGPGVFYAESQLRIEYSQTAQLDVLSPGPYTVLVDRREVLANDSRSSAAGNRQSLKVRLKPGPHRLTVKFTSDAAPFSIDLHPVFSRKRRAVVPLALSVPAQNYIRGLLAWFRGELNQLAQVVAPARDSTSNTLLYLRALLWSTADDHSPRAHAAWQALAMAQPSAVLARIKAADSSPENPDFEHSRSEVATLQKLRPDSEAVAQLAVNLSRANPESMTTALARLIRLHPTCASLSAALKLYDSEGAQASAEATEQQLARCAPESLDYAHVLSASGRHRAAIAFLERRLKHNPLNRSARHMLVQELVLAGDLRKAKNQALQLHRMAPGSASYARLASDPAAVLDSRSERAEGFAAGSEFYSKYHRDGIVAVRRSADAADGTEISTLVLLADQVLDVRKNGTASLYSHRVTRLLTPQAISQYGEVTIPRGADLLHLRTIKRDGRVIEPELTQQRPDISMPALEPGDSIEQEFVTHYPDWRHLPASSLLFQLGAVGAPVLQTRLVVIASEPEELKFELLNGAPQPARTETQDNRVVLTWEMDHLPAWIAEPFSPSAPLPAVQVREAQNAIDRVLDSLVDSTRIGPHVTETLLEEDPQAAVSDREKALRLYRFVTSKIESTGPDFMDTPAEDSLAAGEGSRTSTFLALARAAGIKAALLLARKIGSGCTEDLACYTEPLVRLWLDGQVVDTDAEADGLAFGAVPPAMDRSKALLISFPLHPPDQMPHTPQIVAVSSSPAQERSVGEGDLFLDSRGDLTAAIHIRPGSARSQEIRASLRSGSDRERRSLLEQFAQRLFSGATHIHGQILHLSNPEQPLEIVLQCDVPQYVDMQHGRKKIGQLAPPLGLGNAFTNSATRRSPLLLESAFSENTVFHLHLPQGVTVAALPRDFAIHSEFGDYAVKFSHADGQLNVARQFDIPVQLIEAQSYPKFRGFSEEISEAEHQQIILDIGSSSPLRERSSPVFH
jgi:tetratricopeptide (TPR) repeat protein